MECLLEVNVLGIYSEEVNSSGELSTLKL